MQVLWGCSLLGMLTLQKLLSDLTYSLSILTHCSIASSSSPFYTPAYNGKGLIFTITYSTRDMHLIRIPGLESFLIQLPGTVYQSAVCAECIPVQQMLVYIKSALLNDFLNFYRAYLYIIWIISNVENIDIEKVLLIMTF